MENDIYKNNLEIVFANNVCHTKTHLCIKYGHIITNYGTGMVITWSFEAKPIHVYR